MSQHQTGRHETGSAAQQEQPLSPSAVSLLEEAYGFTIHTVHPVSGGHDPARKCRISTNEGDFLVKTYTPEKSSPPLTQIVASLDVLNYLNNTECPVVPKLRCTRDTSVMLETPSAGYVVQEWLQGNHPTTSREDIAALGTMLATYHNQTAQYPNLDKQKKTGRHYPHLEWYAQSLEGKKDLTPTEQRLKGIVNVVRTQNAALEERIQETKPQALPRALCHKDVEFENSIKTDRGMVLVDFDGASTDYRIAEFAWALHSIVFNWGRSRGPPPLENIVAFIDAYQKTAPLTREEHGLVPAFLRVIQGKIMDKIMRTYHANVEQPQATASIEYGERYRRIVEQTMALIESALTRPVNRSMNETDLYRDVVAVPLEPWLSGQIKPYQSEARKGSTGKLGKEYTKIDTEGLTVLPRARIDKDGHFRIEDEESKKGIAIAQALGYTVVSVQVVDRDQPWREMIQSLRNPRNLLYQKIDHPDFDHWGYARDGERLTMMEPYFADVKGKQGLDVGSCLGAVTRWAAKKRARMEGIEMHQPYVRAAQVLNGTEGTDVRYHQADVLEWARANRQCRFDFVFGLSIFHNIAQAGNPEGAKEALRLFSEMAPVMYFDIGQENEGNAVRNLGLGLTRDNLPAFVRKNTAYTKVEKIGTEEGYCGRDLYRLSR